MQMELLFWQQSVFLHMRMSMTDVHQTVHVMQLENMVWLNIIMRHVF
jgi:hypothetical protein